MSLFRRSAALVFLAAMLSACSAVTPGTTPPPSPTVTTVTTAQHQACTQAGGNAEAIKGSQTVVCLSADLASQHLHPLKETVNEWSAYPLANMKLGDQAYVPVPDIWVQGNGQVWLNTTSLVYPQVASTDQVALVLSSDGFNLYPGTTPLPYVLVQPPHYTFPSVLTRITKVHPVE